MELLLLYYVWQLIVVASWTSVFVWKSSKSSSSFFGLFIFFRYNDSQIYKFENVFQKTFTNTISHFYFETMKFCSIFWCVFGSGISNFLKFLLSFFVFPFFPLNWTFFFFLFFLRYPLCTSLNVLETSTIGVLCFGSCRVFDAPFNASIFHSSSRLSSFPPSSSPNLTKFCSVWF